MPKLENMHFHFHAFSGWGTSKVKNLFLMQFSNKGLYNYYFKFFLSILGGILKSQKIDFPLYFKNVILKRSNVFKEIGHVCFLVFGQYFVGKSPCTTYRLIFEFWSIIVRP